MNYRQALIDDLVRDERLRLKPYVDTAGKTTIGVGRNLTDKGLSRREAFELLDHDVDEALSDLAGAFPWFSLLDLVRQRAIVNLRFNLGPTRFRRFRRMLVALEQGNYVEAADQMRKSRWATQVKARADRLIRMVATGLDA